MQKLMLWSQQKTKLPTLSKEVNIGGSLTMELPKVIQDQFQEIGTAYHQTWMRPLLGQMEGHISLEDLNTGGSQIKKWTKDIQNQSAKDLTEYLILLMLLLFGVEMAKFTSLRYDQNAISI